MANVIQFPACKCYGPRNPCKDPRHVQIYSEVHQHSGDPCPIPGHQRTPIVIELVVDVEDFDKITIEEVPLTSDEIRKELLNEENPLNSIAPILREIAAQLAESNEINREIAEHLRNSNRIKLGSF